MKLKIFNCKTKSSKVFRIFICSFALACTAALFCVHAHHAIANGFIEELINRIALMKY